MSAFYSRPSKHLFFEASKSGIPTFRLFLFEPNYFSCAWILNPKVINCMIFDVLKTYWQIVEFFSTKPEYESDGLVEIFSTRKSWVQSDSYPGFRKILKIMLESCFGKIFHETVWLVPQNLRIKAKRLCGKKSHKTTWLVPHNCANRG